MRYRVTLQYPKTISKHAYTVDLEAESQSLAIATAKLMAPREGYRGAPKSATATHLYWEETA